MSEKNPFVKYTPEQVEMAEQTYYVILLGHDLFSYNKRFTFTKKKAEFYHDQLIEGLMEILETGSDAEKKEAEVCLFFLKIMPLRIH